MKAFLREVTVDSLALSYSNEEAQVWYSDWRTMLPSREIPCRHYGLEQIQNLCHLARSSLRHELRLLAALALEDPDVQAHLRM